MVLEAALAADDVVEVEVLDSIRSVSVSWPVALA